MAKFRPGRPSSRRAISSHARATGGGVAVDPDRERTVNGLPGLAVESGGRIETVFAFKIADDDRITHIWAVRNPDKLRPWQPS